MDSQNLAIICSTDPRCDARIIKQAGTLKSLGYNIAFFGIDSGIAPSQSLLPDETVHLYSKDIFPKPVRAIITRVRRGNKHGTAVERFDPNLQIQDGVNGEARKRNRLKSLKDIAVDMRYLSYIYPAIKADVAQFKPDIIHAHEITAGYSGSKLSKALNCRLIYDAHEFETNREGDLPAFSWRHRRRIESRISRRADAVITVSNEMAEALADMHNVPVPHVIYNTPAADVLCQSGVTTNTVKSVLGLETSRKLAIYVGGIRKNRGLPLILKAMTRVPETDLAFIGVAPESPEAKMIKRMVKLIDGQFNIHFVAPRPPSELVNFISTADVSLIATEDTSLNHRYSMPNKLFESAFARVPVAVTPIAATANFVTTLNLGQVSESYSPEDYALAIRTALQTSPKKYYNTGTLSALETDYSWQAQEKKLSRIYSGLG